MLIPRGGWAWKPELMSGVTIMKMISSTSITSISGVTFGSELTPLPLLVDIAMKILLSVGRERLLRDRRTRAATGCGVELAREARPAELTRHTLDEIVDHLLRGVRHFHREVVNLRAEVVERPHRRNGHENTEGRGDQCFGDTGRDGAQSTGARLRHARERVHDPHDRSEQTDEWRRGAHGREHRDPALQLRDDDHHV